MKIEIAQNGAVMLRELIGEKYHRRVIEPGQDYSGEVDEVFAACEKVHTPEVVAAYLEALAAYQPTPEQVLSAWRATAKCSPMQGKLALGQAEWAKIEAYRATATWAEQVVIDSAQEWRRNSQDIQFFGYMLGYSDQQLDALFEAAMSITT